MGRTLGYGYLEKGFSAGVAQGKWVSVEIVQKDPEKVLTSGIIVNADTLSAEDNKPYFIVNGIGPEAQKNLPTLKVGDVIEGAGSRMISFNGPGGLYLGLVSWEDLGLIYHRQGEVEEPSVKKASVLDTTSTARPKILSLHD